MCVCEYLFQIGEGAWMDISYSVWVMLFGVQWHLFDNNTTEFFEKGTRRERLKHQTLGRVTLGCVCWPLNVSRFDYNISVSPLIRMLLALNISPFISGLRKAAATTTTSRMCPPSLVVMGQHVNGCLGFYSLKRVFGLFITVKGFSLFLPTCNEPCWKVKVQVLNTQKEEAPPEETLNCPCDKYMYIKGNKNKKDIVVIESLQELVYTFFSLCNVWNVTKLIDLIKRVVFTMTLWND